MWNFSFFTSFGQGLAGTARICWMTAKLVWKACPVLLVGVLLLFGIESGLSPLQLALSRAVIDRLAASVFLMSRPPRSTCRANIASTRVSTN